MIGDSEAIQVLIMNHKKSAEEVIIDNPPGVITAMAMGQDLVSDNNFQNLGYQGFIIWAAISYCK